MRRHGLLASRGRAGFEITPNSAAGLILVASTKKDDTKSATWSAVGGVTIEEEVEVDAENSDNANYMRGVIASKVNSSGSAQTVGATNTDSDTVNAIALHIEAA